MPPRQHRVEPARAGADLPGDRVLPLAQRGPVAAAHAPSEGAQRGERRRPAVLAETVAVQVRRLFAAVLVVAGDAVSVEHRLHQPWKRQRIGTLRLRPQLGGRTAQRGSSRPFPAAGRSLPLLVAANAGERLAGMHVGIRAHRLHRQPLPVQRLEVETRAGGRAETGAAVRLDGRRAQHAAAERLGGVPDVRLVGEVVVLWEEADHPQLPDLRAGRPGPPALVDVQHEHRAGGARLRRAGAHRQHRRPGPRFQRDRVEAGQRRVAVEQFPVAEAVDEIEPVIPLPRIVHAEVEVVVQRPGRAVHLAARLVLPLRVRAPRRRLGLGERHLGGQPPHLRRAAVVLPARIDQHQRAVALAVVRGRHRDVAGRVRDRADGQLHPRARLALLGLVAVRAARVAAVRRAAPEVVRRVRVAVDIVPARVHQHAVAVDARLPLVRVVPAQAAEAAAVGIHRV